MAGKPKSAQSTPMMAQYLAIKADHPDALLFYRMGDFYEMFFDDAVAAAAALDIALTKRGKHDGGDIPMCGVPHHAAEGYFLTLIRKGFRVAVCEQMESPAEAKKRGAKSVVHREVVRLVTPGTLSEDGLLDARRHNFLAAWVDMRGSGALAWADMSTGELRVLATTRIRLGSTLARLAPAELIVTDDDANSLEEIAHEMGVPLTPMGRASFDSSAATARLNQVFGVGSLDAFGNFSRSEISAMGALIAYFEITQKGKLPRIRPPTQEREQTQVQIDAATRRNLELTVGADGGRKGTLLSVIDRTVSPAGARMLEQRLGSPLRDVTSIQERLAALDHAHDAGGWRKDLRAVLRRCPDIDRAMSRLSLGRGGPRDLSAIRTALEVAEIICGQIAGPDLPAALATARSALDGHDDLRDLLGTALIAEPPMLARDGGFVASGHDPDLDAARTLRDEGRSVIAAMQTRYAEQAGISTLKIKHNNVLGYFVETTATHANTMMAPPLSETFIHRQTTANQVRFTTLELAELQTRILNAGTEATTRELAIFESLRKTVTDDAGPLGLLARALAELDVTAALAQIAADEGWVRPKIDDSRAFHVTGGRHPVVEAALKRQSGAGFVANDCDLGATADVAAIHLLTGPNMAGKSTYLRQNALIAILAQIGSYVPARTAHIGAVSQIFSRVGASDDLARGRSTFMVEMVETAAILNQADSRALVILDEIGRGTATYDGLSIAWATLEHLHEVNRSRALFATHYHELVALANSLPGAHNATVAVKEWKGEVIFLHEVIPGAADRSYGVQVAQLAGLPAPVISRARQVLKQLEKGEREGKKQMAFIDELPLFSAAAAPEKPLNSAVEDMIANIHPDELTAKQALDLLYKLKEAARS